MILPMNASGPSLTVSAASLVGVPAIGQGMTPQKKLEILRNRARAIAQRPPIPEAGETLAYLEFVVAGEKFGLGIASVQEVCPLKDFAPLPGVPSFIKGVMNLRGRILAILDLVSLFRLPSKGLTSQNKVIFLHQETMTTGVLADEVRGLRTVMLNRLQASLPTLDGKRAEYLKGIAPDCTVILDAGKIMADKTLVLQEDASATQP
jgi:purine-binding chemotaxis protein CheW